MDARSFVDNHIDGLYLLEYLGFKCISESGGMIRACCELHKSDNPTSFAYNLDNNKWFCHSKTCGRGDAYQLLQSFYKINYPEAIVKMAEIFNVDIEKLTLTSIKTKNQKEQEQWLKLMTKKKEETKFNEYELVTDSPVKMLKRFRKFDEPLLSYFGVGHVNKVRCTKKDGTFFWLQNRICIPVRMHGKTIGYSFRRVNNEDILKWVHEGFKTRHVLYGYDECVRYLEENPDCEEIILVEGQIDLWAFHQIGIYNVVCTFGCHIKEEQRLLLERMCSGLILAYDGDEAGVQNTKKIIKENKDFFDISVVEFFGDEDPANVDNLKERLDARIHYKRKGW